MSFAKPQTDDRVFNDGAFYFIARTSVSSFVYILKDATINR